MFIDLCSTLNWPQSIELLLFCMNILWFKNFVAFESRVKLLSPSPPHLELEFVQCSASLSVTIFASDASIAFCFWSFAGLQSFIIGTSRLLIWFTRNFVRLVDTGQWTIDVVKSKPSLTAVGEVSLSMMSAKGCWLLEALKFHLVSSILVLLLLLFSSNFMWMSIFFSFDEFSHVSIPSPTPFTFTTDDVSSEIVVCILMAEVDWLLLLVVSCSLNCRFLESFSMLLLTDWFSSAAGNMPGMVNLNKCCVILSISWNMPNFSSLDSDDGDKKLLSIDFGRSSAYKYE